MIENIALFEDLIVPFVASFAAIFLAYVYQNTRQERQVKYRLARMFLVELRGESRSNAAMAANKKPINKLPDIIYTGMVNSGHIGYLDESLQTKLYDLYHPKIDLDEKKYWDNLDTIIDKFINLKQSNENTKIKFKYYLQQFSRRIRTLSKYYLKHSVLTPFILFIAVLTVIIACYMLYN